MPNFAPIRDVPPGVTEWEYSILTSMKENLEMLEGLRGDSKACQTGSITASVATANLNQILATGSGFSYTSGNETFVADYQKLYLTVVYLANDVKSLRETVATLIEQLQS